MGAEVEVEGFGRGFHWFLKVQKGRVWLEGILVISMRLLGVGVHGCFWILTDSF